MRSEEGLEAGREICAQQTCGWVCTSVAVSEPSSQPAVLLRRPRGRRVGLRLRTLQGLLLQLQRLHLLRWGRILRLHVALGGVGRLEDGFEQIHRLGGRQRHLRLERAALAATNS